MNKHVKWDDREVTERMEADFAVGLIELARLEDQLREMMAVLP